MMHYAQVSHTAYLELEKVSSHCFLFPRIVKPAFLPMHD